MVAVIDVCTDTLRAIFISD